jgi:hypothetical protein
VFELTAATAALALGFAQHTRHVVLEAYTLLLEAGKAGIIKHFHTVFDAADALVQLFILAGNAGEVVIRLAQGVQCVAQFREVIYQWVVFYMHGIELLGSDGLTLPPAVAGDIDPGQVESAVWVDGTQPSGWVHSFGLCAIRCAACVERLEGNHEQLFIEGLA